MTTEYPASLEMGISPADSWNRLLSMAQAGYIPENHDMIYQSGDSLIKELEVQGVDFEGKNVLDVGSGNGRWAAPLTERRIEGYTGLEAIPQCVKFCNDLFKTFPEFSFKHLDVYNPHYISGKNEACEIEFPDTGKYDIVIASSLFTHLVSFDAVVNYIDQMSKALNSPTSDGLLYSTWFFYPPNSPTGIEDRGRRSVFGKYMILDLLCAYGEILYIWDGETTDHNDQTKILLKVNLL